MASVHVAESRGLRKRVALKRLLPHAAESPELVRSFVHEARLVGHLRHPNIAQTYDFGRVGDTYFIAMELVPGPTLAQLIRQCKSTVGIMPPPVALNILCQVCDALAYAHNLCDEQGRPLGLIHRDVSPPNIIVSNTGIVKLIDFGVAKMARSSMQTQVGTVKGKFSYMAPEYLAGQLDSRVDLWALGAVSHELLTNQTLFDAPDDLGVLEKVKRAPVPPPSRRNPDVSRELDTVVLTALERDPDRRWQSAAAMRTALANVATELWTTASNAQMIEWIEWAFMQKPGEERTNLSQLIQLLEKPSQPGAREIAVGGARMAEPGSSRSKPPSLAPSPSRTAPTVPARKRLFSTPRIGAAMVRRRGARRRVFVWLVALAVVVAAGAWVYVFGLPAPLADWL